MLTDTFKFEHAILFPLFKYSKRSQTRGIGINFLGLNVVKVHVKLKQGNQIEDPLEINLKSN